VEKQPETDLERLITLLRRIVRRHSFRIVLAAAGVVLLFASPSHGAPARNAGRPIAVHAHYTEPFETIYGAQCDTESLQCAALSGGVATYTGSIAGTETFSCPSEGLPSESIARGKLRYSCHARFLAPTEVAGCGTGTFSITGTNGETDFAAPDLVTQTFPGKIDWVVDAGSGTGDLRRLSGAGHIVWHENFAGGGYGDATGTVTC
jgi:hypothetical protein